MADLADVTIAKLLCETHPRIRARLEPLAAARDAYAAAAATAGEDVFLPDEVFALARKERRAPARALVAARHRAEESCFGERTCIRAVFAPAGEGRRIRREETEVAEEEPVQLVARGQFAAEGRPAAHANWNPRGRRLLRL